MQDERTLQLIGEKNFASLQSKTILIFGLGGVGGYVAEALARVGIRHFILVDHDIVALSNLNRQIIALHSTLGQKKIEAMKKRILDIRSDAKIECYDMFYLPEYLDKDKLFYGVDYIVDAIDTITAKIDIVLEAQKRGIPLISAMGTGNKLRPELLEVTDIYRTEMCPLCKVMRRELKKRNVAFLKVVYSKEQPQKVGSRTPASMIFVPASAGLLIASEIVLDFLALDKNKCTKYN